MSVTYEERGPVRLLSIDRSDRRNAVNGPTAARLLERFREFEADEDARVLVVTGAGGQAFCAGADLKDFNNDPSNPAGPMGFTRLASTKPTIAAVEGFCVAGGLEIALWCDLRVAAQSAQFGCLERRFGVPLIDGGTQRLPRLVGLGVALDLMLTGRLIDADEALRIGLAQQVVADGSAVETAVELGTEIAGFPWTCVLADRQAALEGIGRPLAEGIAREAELGGRVLEEAARGAARFAGGVGRHGQRSDRDE